MVIDKEFKTLIPALTDEEYKGLEESILKDGCRDGERVFGACNKRMRCKQCQ